MEKNKMSTQLKFRVRTEASINCLGETQGPAPCCFVILDHHIHGAGLFTQLKFRVRTEAYISRLEETQGPAPCCFVILNHHNHGAGA